MLNPGFCTGFALYGIEADSISYTLRDAPGGAILAQETLPMWAQAFGEWEYLFGNLQRTTYLVRAGLPMRPTAQLEVTLTRNDPAVYAELGMFMVGQWRELLAPGSGSMGGTEYGVEVTPKSYSYFKRGLDGTYTRQVGRTAKVINASVVIDAAQAPSAEGLLRRILDTPVAVEASNLPRYGHLSTVGFVTGSIVAENSAMARINLKIEGNI